MKEVVNDNFQAVIEMGENEIMTVKELYEWAVKNGAEDFKLAEEFWVNRWIILKKAKYVASATDTHYIITD